MKSNTAASLPPQVRSVSSFLNGIRYFGEPWPGFEEMAAAAVVDARTGAVSDPAGDTAVYQTALAADALRYLTMQMTATKASGHPGGFASSAEAYAALVMLGHTNIVTEVGHHAPGFYSAMFLDTSLEAMGIDDVEKLTTRFREQHGLLGHLSGAIPGILAPAGPLGQGQHFAMAGAFLHRDKLFPFTVGDGGMGEPYVLSAMMHFHTAYPAITNFLPVLVWNGYSQEHHAMVSTFSNDRMHAYWRGHGFEEIVLVDAKEFDDAGQSGAYVDGTLFSLPQRLAFTRAVLTGVAYAAKAALGGRLACLIVKQLKGAGVHTTGSKSHNLYPGDTLEKPQILDALRRRALPVQAWDIVRENFIRAGGGPAAKTCVTEQVLELSLLPVLVKQEYARGESVVPSTAMGALICQVGKLDRRFVVTNADGNEASGMRNVNEALLIRHPTADALYHQAPAGQVYEPLSEDACAGLASALALFGGRALWLSYESFAINGWPIVQTVTQAMAELRRRTPSLVCMFTAGALEQGRNGWTHQRPELENYMAAMMRNGNMYPLFPYDANCVQVAYEWATNSFNKGIAIMASKSPLPIHADLSTARRAVEEGAVVLHETLSNSGQLIVFAVTGDMVLLPVFDAARALEAEGYRTRVVAVVNPRRLYRPSDVAWQSVSEPDGQFMSDANMDRLFSADALIAVSGGPSAVLEPVLLRARASHRDVVCWKRGETTANPAQIMAFNGITAGDLQIKAHALISASKG